MKSLPLPVLASALACALALPATATAAPASPVAPAPAAAPATAPAGTLRHDLAFGGAYEVAYDRATDSVFVATTTFDADKGGVVEQLDARTLEPRRRYPLERRSFALGLNGKTRTLFVGNTLDGSVTALDLDSGKPRAVFQLATPDADGKVAHTRKVIVDEDGNRLFVTNPAEQGTVWIVDVASGKVVHTLAGLGKWSTGAAWDAGRKHLYVGHGGTEEIAVIDPATGTVETRFDTGDTDGHFFINLALDAPGQRLFASDPETGSLVVFDTRDGSIARTVPIGTGTLDVLFNPHRREVYVTDRGVSRAAPEGTGHLTVIDADSYAVKRTLDLPPHPNSLAINADGSAVYVTVKNARGATTPEGVVRIALD